MMVKDAWLLCWKLVVSMHVPACRRWRRARGMTVPGLDSSRMHLPVLCHPDKVRGLVGHLGLSCLHWKTAIIRALDSYLISIDSQSKFFLHLVVCSVR